MQSLTDEQLKIVLHNHGAALVFAVAGAGKTTSLIHRVERLVREGVFRGKRMLATSFSKESVRDIRKKLDPFPHCADVSVSTLHSVGYGILRDAERMQVMPGLSKNESERDSFQRKLTDQTVKEGRKLGIPIPDYFDEMDFLNYVSTCKANLQYADLDGAKLPAEALKVATQAEAPAGVPYYLDLYRLFEKLRNAENIITFDDMIVLAWEQSLRHQQLLEHVEGKYDCVMVDEFQDLNLAQAELLHLMVRKHQNVMALGDDDQTIYGWRGSSPFFIRNFSSRYDAVKYFITKNFRSYASHLALANFVIEQNQDREKKTLNLTRGFDGNTRVLGMDSFSDIACDIRNEIQENQKKGLKLTDHAVLVRIYALTPFIETELIEHRIPYRVLGNTPFYKRKEVQNLLRYLRLATLEVQLQQKAKLTQDQKKRLTNSLITAVMVPKKFIPYRYVQDLLDGQTSILQRLMLDARLPQHLKYSDGLLKLSAVLGQLVEHLEQGVSAEMALDDLMQGLGYQKHLQEVTASPELAEALYLSAQSLARYAQGKGTIEEFLAHIEHISFQEDDDEQEVQKDRVLITTPYRAKGLQWPVVFVPGANDGTIPMRSSFGDPAQMEEERRVFYVSITRAQQDLHIYHLSGPPPLYVSRFLLNTDRPDQALPASHRTYREVLQETGQVDRALKKTTGWSPMDIHALVHLSHQNHFSKYLTDHLMDHLGVEQVLGLSQHVLGSVKALKAHHTYSPQELEPWEFFGQDPAEVQFTATALEAFRASLAPSPTADVSKPNFTQHLKGTTRPQAGSRVTHPKMGPGVIQELGGDGDRLQVLVQFDQGEFGTKRMLWMFANLTVQG